MTEAQSELSGWPYEELPKFKELTPKVEQLLKSILDRKSIHYHQVTSRTKEPDKIRDKLKIKGYPNPKERLTDVSGIRVIVYFESQVTQVSAVIKDTFFVIPRHTRKAAPAIDRVGYESEHCVCRLGNARSKLPEWSHLSELRFEVQVRTLLQHAWAEFEHDRRYKFSARLPPKIERELLLYAGLLNIADKGFERLSKEIDAYQREVAEHTKAGKLDIELDSLTLEEFVEAWCREPGFSLEPLPDRQASRILLIELRDYGLNKVNDLQQIIPAKYAELAKGLGYSSTIYGLVRDWMILHDYQRYISRAWKQRWHGIGHTDTERDRMFDFYQRLIGPEKATEIFDLFGREGERNDAEDGVEE